MRDEIFHVNEEINLFNKDLDTTTLVIS